MKGSSLASRPGCCICPHCETGRLCSSAGAAWRCGSCGGFLDGTMLTMLLQVIALPEALGSHACECGHPEMRWLPDGIFHCPACGSEVSPPSPSLSTQLTTNCTEAGSKTAAPERRKTSRESERNATKGGFMER